MARKCSPLNLIQAVLFGSTLGVAIAVIVVVYNLWYTYWFGGYYYYNYDSVCLLTYNSVNMCAYMYAVCGVTFFLGLFGLILQFANVRGRTQAVSNAKWLVIVSIFGVCWWLAAAVTATVYTQRVDDIKPEIPQSGDRRATWIMSWVEVGLFTLASVLSLLQCGEARKRADSFVAASPVPPPAGTYAAGYEQPGYSDAAGYGGYQSTGYPAPGYAAPGYAAPGYTAPGQQQPQSFYPPPPPGPYAQPPPPPSYYPPPAGTEGASSSPAKF